MFDNRTREPVVFAVAFCVSDQVYHPFSGEKVMTKDQFGVYLLGFDMAIVIISVWFINFLHVRIN